MGPVEVAAGHPKGGYGCHLKALLKHSGRSQVDRVSAVPSHLEVFLVSGQFTREAGIASLTPS